MLLIFQNNINLILKQKRTTFLQNRRSPPELRGALGSDGCGWGSFKETMKYCKPHFESRAQFNYGQVNYNIWQNNIFVNCSLHFFSCLHSGRSPVQLVVRKWTCWPWGRSPDVTIWSPEDFCKRTELHETWIRYAMSQEEQIDEKKTCLSWILLRPASCVSAPAAHRILSYSGLCKIRDIIHH